MLIVFTAGTVAAGYTIGKGSQLATSGATERAKEEIESKLRKDAEAARYASHSKNALAVMFESIKPRETDSETDPNAEYKRNPIKLPGVMWHPKVAQRDKEEVLRAAKQEGEQAISKMKQPREQTSSTTAGTVAATQNKTEKSS